MTIGRIIKLHAEGRITSADAAWMQEALGNESIYRHLVHWFIDLFR